MNKVFKEKLLNYIKETSHESYKNSKGLSFVDSSHNMQEQRLTFETAILLGEKIDKAKIAEIPFFFEKYTDYSFSQIEDIINNTIDLKNHEYANLEDKYSIFKKKNIVRGLICEGDDVTLYGPRGARPNESSTTFALQIALAISVGYPIFLCPTEKSKVLYINCSLSEDVFAYLLEKQIKGKQNFMKYNESFVPLKLDANYDFISNKEQLERFIDSVNPDIIFFDNLDVIYRSTREKEIRQFLKSIAGERSVVMVYNEDSVELEKIEEKSKVIIGIKKEKNNLVLKNKESAFITWGSVYFDYKKLIFYTKELNKSFYPIIEKDNQIVVDVKDYGLNPPLPW